MNRRRFLSGCIGCGASLLSANAWAQEVWKRPVRFNKPDVASDEGGMWAIMDREEARLRRSLFALRDPQFEKYINEIACRLAGDHCPDIRVHLVQTPLFNANIAANGMMQVWTGLLLRVENEAQLAAVIGHEVGHYLQRHMVERLRDMKARTALAQFLAMFGLVGAIGQIGVLASALAYSRDQEREADSIGFSLMREAGYDTSQAARVWDNLLIELKARPGGDPGNFPMFATHPPAEERKITLQQLAAAYPGGVTHEETWLERTKPFRALWLRDEIKRGQHEESIALLTRMVERPPPRSDVLCARGEIYRLRAAVNDFDAALSDYHAAVAVGGEPPETHRGMGLIYRTRSQSAEARVSFQRYLEAAPEAPDALMVKSYLEELGA